MKTLPVEEALAFLWSIDRGEVTLRPVGETWDEVFAGNVEFEASNGWLLTVFNDCDSWDYIDEIRSNDGRSLKYEEMVGTDVDRWHPSEEAARQIFGTVKTNRQGLN